MNSWTAGRADETAWSMAPCRCTCLLPSLCPRNYLSKIMRHVVQNLGPPVDGRTVRSVRDCPKQDHARSFFEFLWCNLAEPLAESEAAHEMEEEDYLMDSFHEHVLGAIPDDGAVEGLGVGTDREMRPGQCSELPVWPVLASAA